jgi:hypothetical protein
MLKKKKNLNVSQAINKNFKAKSCSNVMFYRRIEGFKGHDLLFLVIRVIFNRNF